MLNPLSPIPLYRQLAERLQAEIRAGLYQAGEKIPSETHLASEFGIGRPTVRQATDYLIRQGILVRRRGSGTFVCRNNRKEVDLFGLSGSLASFHRKGLEPDVKLLAPVYKYVIIKKEENPLNEKEVYRIHRLYVIDGCPIVLEYIYLDAEVFRGLEQYSLENHSLSQLVKEKYYLIPSGGKQTFRISYPDSEQSELLGVSLKKPLLLVKRTMDFPGAAEAVFVELFCLTDQFVFSQPLGGINHD